MADCELLLCVYQENGSCQLDGIIVNEYGMCESAVFVTIPDDVLIREKEKQRSIFYGMDNGAEGSRTDRLSHMPRIGYNTPMGLLVMTFTLRAPFAHSLKEKRACVKSLLAKLRGRFNVTVCEADAQDVHQLIVLRVAAFAGNHALADALYETVCRFVQANTQAELIDQEQEYL